MSARKTLSPPKGDVPTIVVIGLVVLLVAIFAPIVALTPALPTDLPPLSFDSNAILKFHEHVPVAHVPAYVDESYAGLANAQFRRDRVAIVASQRDFAAMVADATSDAPADEHAAIRESYLRRFVASLESTASTREPLLDAARRHRLVGADASPEIGPATRIAWFDVRWEALAARENLRDETIPLDRLLRRVPDAEARALVAWALDAECSVLLGASADEAADITRCAALRDEFVGMARVLDARYPVDDARAGVEVLRATALARFARSTHDEAARDEALRDANEALERAHGIFTALAARAPTRLLRRYVLGTAEPIALQ